MLSSWSVSVCIKLPIKKWLCDFIKVIKRSLITVTGQLRKGFTSDEWTLHLDQPGTRVALDCNHSLQTYEITQTSVAYQTLPVVVWYQRGTFPTQHAELANIKTALPEMMFLPLSHLKILNNEYDATTCSPSNSITASTLNSTIFTTVHA